MSIVSVSAAVIIAVFLATLLKQQRGEQALMVVLAAGVGLMGLIAFSLTPIFESLNELFESAGQAQYFALLIKALGICLITRFAASFCADSGNSSLAEKVGLLGRCGVIVLALPLIAEIVEFTKQLMNV